VDTRAVLNDGSEKRTDVSVIKHIINISVTPREREYAEYTLRRILWNWFVGK
jgi:hypothetical protein